MTTISGANTTVEESSIDRAIATVDDIVDEANMLLLGVVTEKVRDGQRQGAPAGLDKLVRRLNTSAKNIATDLSIAWSEYESADNLHDIVDSINETGTILRSIAELIVTQSERVSERIALLADRMESLADGLHVTD